MNKSIATLQENIDKLFQNSKIIELVNYSENKKSIDEYKELFKIFFNLEKINLFKINFQTKQINGENYLYYRNSIQIDFEKKDFEEIEIIQIYFFIKLLKEDKYNINYTGIELNDLEKYFEEIDCSNGLCKAKQQFVFELDNILANQSISVKNHIIAIANELKIKINNIQKELEKNSVTIKNVLAGEDKIYDFNEILDTFLSKIIKENNEENIIELVKSFSTNQKTIGFFVKSKISNFLNKSKKVKGKEIIDEFIKKYEKIDLFYNFSEEKDLLEYKKLFISYFQLKTLIKNKKYKKEELEKQNELLNEYKQKLDLLLEEINNKKGIFQKQVVNTIHTITEISNFDFGNKPLDITFD